MVPLNDCVPSRQAVSLRRVVDLAPPYPKVSKRREVLRRGRWIPPVTAVLELPETSEPAARRGKRFS